MNNKDKKPIVTDGTAKVIPVSKEYPGQDKIYTKDTFAKEYLTDPAPLTNDQARKLFTSKPFPTEKDVEKFIKELPKPLNILEAKRRLCQDLKEAKELIKKEFPRIDVNKYILKNNKCMVSFIKRIKKYLKKT